MEKIELWKDAYRIGNDVIGEQPKTPAETADMKPSQQSDPETSLSVMSLPSPP